MEKDKGKKLEEVLQSNWTNFQSSLKEYMLQKGTTKGMQRLWEHFQIYLCIWEYRTDWNKEPERQAMLISEKLLQIQVQKDGKGINVFEEARRMAEKEERHRRNGQIWSVCNEIPRKTDFSDYRDVIGENVESNIDGYQAVWIGICRAEASEQEKVTAAVVLEFLARCSDNLNIVVKASREQWERKKEFDFIQCYKDTVLSTYAFPEEKIIKDIASERYETRENNAAIFFMNKTDIDALLNNHKSESSEVSFLSSCYQEYKMGDRDSVSSTRKMLETCSAGNMYLLVEREKPNYLRGIVTGSRIDNIADKEISIHFMGRGEWKICKGKETFLIFQNNQYYTDDSRVDIDLDEKIAQMVSIAEDKRDKFKKIFQKMEEQQHGALIIIADDAASETDRLCSIYQRGMQVDALDMDNEDALNLLSGLASIDGAVMIDFEGKCHGFSVILDGGAQVKGNTGRGARYNSSTNYIAGKNRYSVIVSEDRERGIEIFYGFDQKSFKR